MSVFTENANVVLSSIAAIAAYFFGEFWFFFIAFFILNIIDYITGIVKANHMQTLSSASGSKGIIKKVGYWIVIAISFFVSVSCIRLGEMVSIEIEFLSIVGYFVLATYIINEIRSILENLVAIGLNIPHFLINGLEITGNLLERKQKENEKKWK